LVIVVVGRERNEKTQFFHSGAHSVWQIAALEYRLKHTLREESMGEVSSKEMPGNWQERLRKGYGSIGCLIERILLAGEVNAMRANRCYFEAGGSGFVSRIPSPSTTV
jgi:hypothetical protein